MSKKHEIEKEKLEEIIEIRKQTKNTKEDKRLHALELRQQYIQIKKLLTFYKYTKELLLDGFINI